MLYKFLRMCTTILLVITCTFFVLRVIPGGPFSYERRLDEVALENLNKKYQLDKPLVVQYAHYINNILHGDFGMSMIYQDYSVKELILTQLKVSLQIALPAMCILLSLSVFFGALASIYRDRYVDMMITAFVNFFKNFPVLAISTILIYIFSTWIKILPVAGWDYKGASILPIFAVVLYRMPIYISIFRTSFAEILDTTYIKAAVHRGIPLRWIILRHAIKPAIMPIVNILSSMFISSVFSSMVTENVFAIPGIGRLIVEAASNRDYSLVMGLVILVSIVVVTIRWISNMLFYYLNPKLS